MLGLTRRKDVAPGTRPQITGLRRLDPWVEFTRLGTEIDPLFRAFFGPTLPGIEETGTFTPAVDLYETAEELVLHAYLPGVSQEDIHLEVVGDTIRLWGERKPIVPETEVTVHLAQSGYGTFDLRYTLPVNVQTERCTATYRNGILEVHLPKVEAARPRTVEIHVAG
jgi:HSP20 family protein